MKGEAKRRLVVDVSGHRPKGAISVARMADRAGGRCNEVSRQGPTPGECLRITRLGPVGRPESEARVCEARQ